MVENLDLNHKTMQAKVSQNPGHFNLKGFLKLVRVSNLVIIVFTQYMIKLFLIEEELDVWNTLNDPYMFLLSLATSLIAAGGYIINDYYDVKIDTVNKPQRVVVGKILKRRVALGAHLVLSVTGVGIGLLLSKWVFLVCFVASFLLWFYSNRLKRLPLIGNLTIALLTAFAVIVVAVYYPQNQLLVYMFALFAFFISLIREIVKDMEDVRGDANFGCKTLPIIWGIRRTKRVIYVFFFTFTIIVLSTYISFPNEFAIYLYVTVLPSMIWFFVRLTKADTRKDFRFLSNLCKAIMILGVISMMLI